ncbi:MAG TPA: phosphotransferase family protein [Acidimicrobiales bacterium]|nr:phosphotransferase family protein [Acidimicrobiales bacterium]
MASPAPASSELAEALRSVLEPVLGTGLEVGDVQRMPGGSSRETWAFSATSRRGPVRRLVLRRDPTGAPASGLVLEADLLRAAAGAGVPVPAVVASGTADSALGAAFVVVGHIEGEALPRRVQRLAADTGTGPALTAQCGRILAAVHGIPPASVPGLSGGDQLEQQRGLLDHLGQPHPAFELALRWLAENRPARSGEVVVHGDFRNGNLIVGPDGVRAVLDWELAHRGDPLEDLGWMTAKAWRFGSELPVGGLGTVEQLVAGYEGAGGGPVDRQALTWWETLATLRWGIICIVQALTHTSGAVRSVELAAIGRRVCEVEWDLLAMVDR